jgi:hypothetical protein
MSSNSRTAVSAELGLGLVGPEHTIVPPHEGIGDVKAWPSAASGQGPETLNISMTELTELLSQA